MTSGLAESLNSIGLILRHQEESCWPSWPLDHERLIPSRDLIDLRSVLARIDGYPG